MFLFSEDYMKMPDPLSYLDLFSINRIIDIDKDSKKVNNIFSIKCRLE